MNYNLFLIKQFESLLIRKGSTKLSRNFFNKFFNEMRQETQKPLKCLDNSISNIQPNFLIITRKKGKRVFQVPRPVLSKKKRVSSGIKNIIKNSKNISEKTFIKSCQQEVINASLNKGFSKKQQQDLYKLVLLNRAALQFNK